MSSIEAGIHQHWGNYKPLSDLVPESRVFTGEAKGEPAFPYVTIQREGDSGNERTSSGTYLESATIRFHIWDEDLDRAKRVATAVREHFNRAGFEWPGGAVQDMKPTNEIEFQEPDTGTWHATRDFITRARFSG